ncbi:tetratricopeptide repeat-containing protein EMW1 [Spizellomyces punctatus DAOM BR117]|uniref:Uncharacterized protein n=1 Tax=Spizellomyces punctatus (strain DAOM BR117) TaxID=645134 RepID=A0A0L0HQ90_SPIPD|nr:tetratricopeptide repeat-containing protein EMW1 [Spizellomyces punctatus DAOM BR117]KND03282.1 hypothetical protein SPPG_02333 [Spizellomyces punctatus DAOM BR117]|eukprot:XP_016611321.1 hypothetical protein SPPG_02333 [Spizellomyces punctatus DAOM BR117]
MTRSLESLEWSLILGRLPTEATHTPQSSLVDLIIHGHYHKALQSQAAVEVFGSNVDIGSDDIRCITESFDATPFILSRLKTYLADTEGGQFERQFEVLCVGVACLYAFLQSGWTGPRLNMEPVDILPEAVHKYSEDLRKKALENLVEDGEEVYSLTPRPLFLVYAKVILVDGASLLSDLKSTSWWRARTLFTQQKLLENPAATLCDDILASLEQVAADIPSEDDTNGRELRTRYNLELGLVHHWYKQDSKSVPYLEAAQAASRFKWTLTGALGKRTKFQEFDVSQLVVMAESAQDVEETNDKEHGTQCQPKTLALNDDTLLETIEFTQDASQEGQSAATQGNLKVIDQCILLAFCLNVKNTNPAHGLTTEEMLPYVRRVLENANNWMVHTMGLLLRSRLESNKSRTVERAALQLQALVDQFPLEESSVSDRMLHIFSIMLPAKWEMERELAERFVSLGVTRTALEIFERLELWEDVISCYQMLEQDKKAEALVQERLKITPRSPKLHCILGDLKQDPSYYEMAWKLSDGRYARAMRSLGAYYFKRSEWVKSIECYHRALAINSLFENSWFVMGCAAMRAEDWDQAVRAFSRVTSLDHENGEAWTNLASVYVRQKKKREAWRALREAIKQHFDNSKIWENYLYTSIDLGEFQEAIHAMERVLDTRWDKAGEKENVVDVEVLDILVNAVVNDIADAKGQPASRLSSKLNRLLNSITSKVATNPAVFSCVAKFAASRGLYRRALDYRLKAYRCLLHHPQMADDEYVFKMTVAKALELVDAYVTDGPRMEAVRMGATEDDPGKGEEARQEEMVCKDWAYQARMVLRTLIGRTKSTFEDHPQHDELKGKLQEITELARA